MILLVVGGTFIFIAVGGGLLWFVLTFISDQILDIILSEKSNSCKIKDVQSEIEKCNKEIENYQKADKADRDDVARSVELVRNIPFLESKEDELNKKLVDDKRALIATKREQEETLSKHLYNANMVLNSLVENYSSLLDTRDWVNLDLTLYNIETGRADSVKEALQQVDMENRNNRLIDSMGVATRQIAESITNGMRNVGITVASCAQLLASQLSIISNQVDALSYQVENIETSQRKLRSEIAELASVSKSAIENSMRGKANTSSKEMVDDIHQIRILMDNAEVRRRNS